MIASQRPVQLAELALSVLRHSKFTLIVEIASIEAISIVAYS
jgi:hypothetical protein